MADGGKDALWLLLGVLLIFGTMAAFSPSSQLGKAFLGFRKSMENVFGGEVAYCPFINPYAMSIYSAGGLEITGNHPLCGPVKYATGEELISSEVVSELETELTTIQAVDVDSSTATYDASRFGFEDLDAALLDFERNINQDNKDAVELILAQYISLDGELVSLSDITDEESENHQIANSCAATMFGVGLIDETGEYITVTKKELGAVAEDPVDYPVDEFFASLASVQSAGIKSSNSIAIQLLTEKRPAWQCFIIFGLLPFLVTYYLLNDVLSFAYFRTNTKRLIAIFASLIAVLTGAFANLIVAVAGFVGLTLGQSFLLAVFSLAVLAVLFGQITLTAGVAKQTVNAVQDIVTGTLVLKKTAESAKGPQTGQGGN